MKIKGIKLGKHLFHSWLVPQGMQAVSRHMPNPEQRGLCPGKEPCNEDIRCGAVRDWTAGAAEEDEHLAWSEV